MLITVLGGLRGDQSTLDNLIQALMPELSAANQSVMENGTKHAANLTAEARLRQRLVIVTIVTVSMFFVGHQVIVGENCLDPSLLAAMFQPLFSFPVKPF